MKKTNFKYLGLTPTDIRKHYLKVLEEHTDPTYFDIIVRLVDLRDQYQKDPLVFLVEMAEQACLKEVNFDPSEWLKGEDLARFMELENEEQIKFGLEPEWLQSSIDEARGTGPGLKPALPKIVSPL